MERALLQGERQAELDQIEAETDIISQLQHKLDELESAIQREKDKVQRAVDRGYILTQWGKREKHTYTHCLSSSSLLNTLVSYTFPSWFVAGGAFT